MPSRLPPDAVESLKRKEWFPDPNVVDRARLVILPFCPSYISSRRRAITLGHLIIITRPQYYDSGSLQDLALLAHELKHVEQYRREGLLRFLWRYLRHWVQVGYDLKKHPYEREAAEFEARIQAQLQDERPL